MGTFLISGGILIKENENGRKVAQEVSKTFIRHFVLTDPVSGKSSFTKI
jgi:hypothetical protein